MPATYLSDSQCLIAWVQISTRVTCNLRTVGHALWSATELVTFSLHKYIDVPFSPYLIRHGELKEVQPVGVPLHDDLLEVLQVLKGKWFQGQFMEYQMLRGLYFKKSLIQDEDCDFEEEITSVKYTRWMDAQCSLPQEEKPQNERGYELQTGRGTYCKTQAQK